MGRSRPHGERQTSRCCFYSNIGPVDGKRELLISSHSCCGTVAYQFTPCSERCGNWLLALGSVLESDARCAGPGLRTLDATASPGATSLLEVRVSASRTHHRASEADPTSPTSSGDLQRIRRCAAAALGTATVLRGRPGRDPGAHRHLPARARRGLPSPPPPTLLAARLEGAAAAGDRRDGCASGAFENVAVDVSSATSRCRDRLPPHGRLEVHDVASTSDLVSSRPNSMARHRGRVTLTPLREAWTGPAAQSRSSNRTAKCRSCPRVRPCA